MKKIVFLAVAGLILGGCSFPGVARVAAPVITPTPDIIIIPSQTIIVTPSKPKVSVEDEKKIENDIKSEINSVKIESDFGSLVK